MSVATGPAALRKEPPSGNRIVHLTVGERKLTTWKATVANASFHIANIFRPEWELTMTLEDGSLFIDRDGDMFAHILDYLRSDKYPLLYDQQNSFDEALYEKLLVEAQYFMVSTAASPPVSTSVLNPIFTISTDALIDQQACRVDP